MTDIEMIRLINETLTAYKQMINQNLLHEISNPTTTLAHTKMIVGQMGGAEGFVQSLIEILTPEEDNE